MSVGERIRELRKAIGYTQKELAEMAGVATVSIQQYERGVRQPRIDQLNKIAAVFQVPLSHFVGVEPVEILMVDPESVSKEQESKWEEENRVFRSLVEYLETIDFELGYEVADFEAELYYSLKDLGENKMYILSEEEVSIMADSMQRYVRFLLHDILKNKSPLEAETATQSTLSPQAGEDTTMPENVPGTPSESE